MNDTSNRDDDDDDDGENLLEALKRERAPSSAGRRIRRRADGRRSFHGSQDHGRRRLHQNL